MIQGIDSAHAGLAASLERFERTAAGIARVGTGSPGEGDLVADLINLQTEKIAIAANVMVVRTANEMLGTLLDLIV